MSVQAQSPPLMTWDQNNLGSDLRHRPSSLPSLATQADTAVGAAAACRVLGVSGSVACLRPVHLACMAVLVVACHYGSNQSDGDVTFTTAFSTGMVACRAVACRAAAFCMVDSVSIHPRVVGSSVAVSSTVPSGDFCGQFLGFLRIQGSPCVSTAFPSMHS